MFTVRFRSGIEILSISDLVKVLGDTDYRTQVAAVCNVLGITPPWKRMPMSTYTATTVGDNNNQGRIKHPEPATTNTTVTTPDNNAYLSSFTSEIEQIKTEVASVKTDAKATETKVAQLSTVVTGLTAEVAGLSGKQDNVLAMLAKIMGKFNIS
jgi:TolA-binding protein